MTECTRLLVVELEYRQSLSQIRLDKVNLQVFSALLYVGCRG